MFFLFVFSLGRLGLLKLKSKWIAAVGCRDTPPALNLTVPVFFPKCELHHFRVSLAKRLVSCYYMQTISPCYCLVALLFTYSKRKDQDPCTVCLATCAVA